MLILQETHSSIEIEKLWKAEWGGDVIFNHGTSSARGIAVFMTKGLSKYVSNIHKDEDGRLIIFDVNINGQCITVVAVYAPNSDSPAFMQKIGNLLRNRSEHKILLGDFNFTLNVDLDRKNTYHNNNRARDELNNISSEYSLKDIWRIQNGEKREYSWFKSGDLKKASRIDYAMVSAGLDQKIKVIMYIPGCFTDHRALYILVEIRHQERGVGYWKLNTRFLGRKNMSILSMMKLSKLFPHWKIKIQLKSGKF